MFLYYKKCSYINIRNKKITFLKKCSYIQPCEKVNWELGIAYFCWENRIPCTGTSHKTFENFVHLDNGISSLSGSCFYNSKI